MAETKKQAQKRHKMTGAPLSLFYTKEREPLGTRIAPANLCVYLTVSPATFSIANSYSCKTPLFC